MFSFWPFRESVQSLATYYGAVVICDRCKFAIPNALSIYYHLLISLPIEQRITKLMEILMEEFDYYPKLVKFNFSKLQMMAVYLELDRPLVLEKFLNQVDTVMFKCLPNVDLAQKLVEMFVKACPSSKPKLNVVLSLNEESNTIIFWRNLIDALKRLNNLQLEFTAHN